MCSVMIPTHRLRQAHIPGYSGLQDVVVAAGVITAIQPSASPIQGDRASDPSSLDLAGDWLSLGGVDLQINGALGLPFPDLTPENADKLTAINQFLWQQGVDAYLPTIVTASVEQIQRSLSVIAAHQSAAPVAGHAAILGAHLEGPCLNPDKRGAHPQEHLQPLTIAHLQTILGDHAAAVQVMTLAPELDPTGEVIPYLRSQGITVSLGHSLATAAQATAAFEQGARMVTHAFNAMPPLHHRQPGLLAAAIVHPQVACGFIADGQHIDPLMLDVLLRAAGYEQGLFLVSDALSPLGLPDGVYPWDTRQIEVKQGTARLPDGTLSGTTLGLLVGVQNLVQWGICSVAQAIALATVAPRRAIGLPTDWIGQPAHLLRWHLTGDRRLTWSRLSLPSD